MVPEGEDGGGARLGAVAIDRYDILISSTDCIYSRGDSSHFHLISPSLQSWRNRFKNYLHFAEGATRAQTERFHLLQVTQRGKLLGIVEFEISPWLTLLAPGHTCLNCLSHPTRMDRRGG